MNLFTFIKELLSESGKKQQYKISADEARKITQCKADREYFDYKCRRRFLLKTVYESIKNLALEGKNYLVITSGSFVDRWETHKRWDQKDIDWFAEDFKKDFVDDGYEFVYGQDPKLNCGKNRILIKW